MKAQFWFILTVLYATLISIGSSIPGADIPSYVFNMGDSILHFTEYLGFGFLLVMTFRPEGTLGGLIPLFSLGIGYAVLDETMQRFTPGRTPSWQDAVSDTTGMLIVMVVTLFVRRMLDARGGR